MNLPAYSNEQYSVIQELKTNNVLVDSVAGSGKTTTNLHLALHYPEYKILLLTYNAKLKIETRQKVIKYNIQNVEVHSYHSFCVKYYQRNCYTDSVIKKMLKNDALQSLKKFTYDLIVLDECQDMTPLYYELFCKIYKDNKQINNIEAKICILGDKYQSIYQFNNADARFITQAEKLFTLNSLSWKKTHLSYSFRVTHEIASFINNCMLNDERIKSRRVSFNKPKYMICDCFGSYRGHGSHKTSVAFLEIKQFLEEGYKPSDIFILAPSVKNSRSPVRLLENEIKKKLIDIPIYVPVSDEEKLDQEVLKNKMVFSTFHQAKGLERKIVIVFNFDASYFKYFKKKQNPNICPNEMYVATTRAKNHLILLHHYQNDFLPFINKHLLTKYANVKYYTKMRLSTSKNNKNRKTSVTDLIRHLTQETVDTCLQYITLRCRREKGELIRIKSKTKQKFGHENVSEITGTAIPSYFEYQIKGSMGIFDRLGLNPNLNIESEINKGQINDTKSQINSTKELDFLSDSDEEEIEKTNKKLDNNHTFDKEIELNHINVEQLLYVANKWCSHKSGYIFKLDQIMNYDWLSDSDLKKCVERLNTLNITSNAEFEHRSEIENKQELFDRKLVGYVDCIDGNNVYEFKCVNKLKKEHVLQLAIYKYLYLINKSNTTSISEIFNIISEKDTMNTSNDDHQKDMKFYLYNILSDKLMEVKGTLENLQKMMEYLIYTKYFGKTLIDDISFNAKCQKIRKKYMAM